MAGSKVSGPIQTTLHVKLGDAPDLSGNDDAAKWVKVKAAFAAGGETAAKAAAGFSPIERTVNIGDQGESANPLTWTEFGEDRQKSIAGPASTSTFTFGVVSDGSKPVQQELLKQKNGTAISLAVLTISDSKAIAASAEATVDYMRGTIASKSKVRGTTGPNQINIELAIEDSSVFHQA